MIILTDIVPIALIMTIPVGWAAWLIASVILNRKGIYKRWLWTSRIRVYDFRCKSCKRNLTTIRTVKEYTMDPDVCRWCWRAKDYWLGQKGSESA